jgi:hypothetical protein
MHSYSPDIDKNTARSEHELEEEKPRNFKVENSDIFLDQEILIHKTH